MLRMTEYLRNVFGCKEMCRQYKGMTLIWNLTNRCNLHCGHCYSSASQNKEQELSIQEITDLLTQLKEAGVMFAILSGGEPLMREDIFDIAEVIRESGIKTYLSTNGLLVDETNIDRIKHHFEYVGVSIDGEPHVHDSFRGKEKAFEKSLEAIRLCIKKGIRTGLRFTLTPSTYRSIPFIFELVEEEGIPKIYISHLVYSGRGNKLSDIDKSHYRSTMEFILDKVFYYVEHNISIDVVTGNNDADAVLFLREMEKRYPGMSGRLYEQLRQWGGNQAGIRLVNIDYLRNVKPDPFFFDSLGNLIEKSFLDIWNSNGLLSGLRERPRRLKGRCKDCPYLEICNGNSRARAYAVHRDYFEEDPACYIS